MAKEKLERIVEFSPAYDKRNADPKKDYGIGAVRCFMVLRGEKGVITFSFSTGMLLPKTITEYIKAGRAKYELTSYGHYFLNKPMGFSVDYHDYQPHHEGQEVVGSKKAVRPKNFNAKDPKAWNKVKYVKTKPPVCRWLGVPCFCDGSCMAGESLMAKLIEKGSEAVWKELEKWYADLKGKPKGKKK